MSTKDVILQAVVMKHSDAIMTITRLIEFASPHLREDHAVSDLNELITLKSTTGAFTTRRGAKYIERVAFHVLGLNKITSASETVAMQSLWLALSVREQINFHLQKTLRVTRSVTESLPYSEVKP